MSHSDFPFGYRLLPDTSSQIAATEHERRARATRRPVRVHRLPWPRGGRAAENL